MLAEDVKPNRLGNAKMFIERILGKLNGNRLGMVIFAGDAFVQMPITTDVRSARLYLSSTSTNDISVQGTDIAKALTLAARSFSSSDDASKVIILMTDGENHEEDAIEVAKSLKEQGIIVMTVGFGSPSGVPIPNKNGSGYMKDRDGNTVMTKLDEQGPRRQHRDDQARRADTCRNCKDYRRHICPRNQQFKFIGRHPQRTQQPATERNHQADIFRVRRKVPVLCLCSTDTACPRGIPARTQEPDSKQD